MYDVQFRTWLDLYIPSSLGSRDVRWVDPGSGYPPVPNYGVLSSLQSCQSIHWAEGAMGGPPPACSVVHLTTPYYLVGA